MSSKSEDRSIAELDGLIRQFRKLRRQWERSRGDASTSRDSTAFFDEVVIHFEDSAC